MVLGKRKIGIKMQDLKILFGIIKTWVSRIYTCNLCEQENKKCNRIAPPIWIAIGIVLTLLLTSGCAHLALAPIIGPAAIFI